MKDEREMAMSPEERTLRHALTTAMLCRWVVDEKREGARKLVFVNGDFRIHDYHSLMIAGDDNGFVLGAQVFKAMMAEKEVDATVRSHLLTRLARSLYDSYWTGSEVEPIRESQVSWFGRFIKHLIKGNEDMFLAWAESMNADDPYNDFRPQPTAVIRGALFAPSLNQEDCAPFWEKAVAMETFPLRVFSDPCESREGCIFSGYHRRVLVAILSAVSPHAATSISAYIREQAVNRCVGTYDAGTWSEHLSRACQSDREAMFEIILQSIQDVERRTLVADELHRVPEAEQQCSMELAQPPEPVEALVTKETVEA